MVSDWAAAVAATAHEGNARSQSAFLMPELLCNCRAERQAQRNSKRPSEFAVRSVAQGSRTLCTGGTVRWSLANAAKGA